VFFNGQKPHATTLAPRLGADNQAFGLADPIKRKQEIKHEL
jgi:CoA:oxalate CoA-transferase